MGQPVWGTPEDERVPSGIREIGVQRAFSRAILKRAPEWEQSEKRRLIHQLVDYALDNGLTFDLADIKRKEWDEDFNHQVVPERVDDDFAAHRVLRARVVAKEAVNG